MKTYEYKILKDPGEDTLNELGSQGYRVVGVTHQEYPRRADVYMQRRVNVWTPNEVLEAVANGIRQAANGVEQDGQDG